MGGHIGPLELYHVHPWSGLTDLFGQNPTAVNRAIKVMFLFYFWKGKKKRKAPFQGEKKGNKLMSFKLLHYVNAFKWVVF